MLSEHYKNAHHKKEEESFRDFLGRYGLDAIEQPVTLKDSPTAKNATPLVKGEEKVAPKGKISPKGTRRKSQVKRTVSTRSSPRVKTDENGETPKDMQCPYEGCGFLFTDPSGESAHLTDVHQESHHSHCPLPGCFFSARPV